MVYGSNITVVKTSNVTIKIGGTELAKGSTIKPGWGNDIVEDPLIGSEYPDQSTHKFGGTITIEFLYITDLHLDSLTNPGSDGQVPETTVTVELTDMQSPAKTDTWTLKVRFNYAGFDSAGRNGNVFASITGRITERPTRSQS